MNYHAQFHIDNVYSVPDNTTVKTVPQPPHRSAGQEPNTHNVFTQSKTAAVEHYFHAHQIKYNRPTENRLLYFGAKCLQDKYILDDMASWQDKIFLQK